MLKKSKLLFVSNYPNPKSLDPQRTLVIYDKILTKDLAFRNFLKFFPETYPVNSGEGLKSLDSFLQHFEAIAIKLQRLHARPLRVLAVGGGSIGDFSGFLASVFQRGIELVHMPSTWLSAVDSAHGGKTALNSAVAKNQIGTFYPADQVILVKQLLMRQPPERAIEAQGEILKISLIAGGRLHAAISNAPQIDAPLIWKILPLLIQEKLKVVHKDPFEKKGIRQMLNLGHTLGHVFETQLKLPHGTAVKVGLGFSLQWSLHRRNLNSDAMFRLRQSPAYQTIPLGSELAALLRKLKKPEKQLLKDKKATSHSRIRFIFLRGPGKILIESIPVREILTEIKRQSL